MRLRLQEHKLILAVGDLICVNVALGLTLSLRANLSLGPLLPSEQLPWFALISLLWVGLGVALGIYDLSLAAKPADSTWAAAGAALVTFAIFLSVPILTPVLPAHRVELFSFPVLSILGLAAWRGSYSLVLRRTQFITG